MGATRTNLPFVMIAAAFLLLGFVAVAVLTVEGGIDPDLVPSPVTHSERAAELAADHADKLAAELAARRRRKFPAAFAFIGRKTIIHVRDRDGRPVEGARVFRGTSRLVETRTDAEGDAALRLGTQCGIPIRVEWKRTAGLVVGRWDAIVQEQVNVTLGRAERVAGQVFGADGSPAIGRRVRLRTRSEVGPSYTSIAVVDEVGSFAFEPLPLIVLKAGVYVAAVGHEVQSPAVRVARPWDDERIDLPPIVTLQGRFLDQSGQPIFVAWVTSPRVHGTWTDRNGRFTLRLFGSPNGRLTVWKLKHTELIVPFGMESKDLGDMRFPAPRRVEGVLMGPDHRSVPNTKIELKSVASGRILQRAVTADDGTFVFDRASPGAHWVVLRGSPCQLAQPLARGTSGDLVMYVAPASALVQTPPPPPPITVAFKLLDAESGREIVDPEMTVESVPRGARGPGVRVSINPEFLLELHAERRKQPGLDVPQAGTYDLLLNFRKWELIRLRGVEINRKEPLTLTVELRPRKP